MQNKKGKLCTKLTSSFLRKWWVVLAIAIAMLVGGALVVAFFTMAVEFVIDDQITLKPGGQTFEMWRKPPVNPILKVYVYNVTNADEFLNVVPGEPREKPILDELGPYVYVETWEKVNLTFHDNGTLTYNQRKVYVFDREQSAGSEDDMVVVPNVPMLSATSQSKHAARFLRLAMASIMDILKVKPFVEVSVGQLLWGYEDPLLKLAKDVVPKEQKLPYEEFGLLYGLQYIVNRYGLRTLPELMGHLRLDRLLAADGPLLDGILAVGTDLLLGNGLPPRVVQKVPKVQPSQWRTKERREREDRQPYNPRTLTRMSLMGRPKNGTSRDNMTVFTGANDIRMFAALDKFNGRSHLSHWSSESCNQMTGGSDGSLFPPRIQPETVLHVFDKDMCRKLPLVFKKQIESKGGVKAYRFGPDERAFGDIDHNVDNKCYCPSSYPPPSNVSMNPMPVTMSTPTSPAQCAPHGTFNVSLCQYDSPVLLSFPHFYLGDPKLRDAVIGLEAPTADQHEFYIDIQPEMGVAMRARARVQINLAVSQVIDIKQVATFPDIVFPIMWFEEGIDELPDSVIQLLRLATQTPPVAKAALQYTLFVCGALLLVLATGCLVRNSHRQETLSLEGTAHYSNGDEKKKPVKKSVIPAAPPSAMNGGGGANGHAKANAGYVADDE